MPLTLTPAQIELWNKTLDELIKILKTRISPNCVEPEDDELRGILRQTLSAIRSQKV